MRLTRIEQRKQSIGQRAKEIAQERGWNPIRSSDVEDAAKYIAEDVEDIPEQWLLNFLARLRGDLENPNSEMWKRIKLEAKRWRPGSHLALSYRKERVLLMVEGVVALGRRRSNHAT